MRGRRRCRSPDRKPLQLPIEPSRQPKKPPDKAAFSVRIYLMVLLSTSSFSRAAKLLQAHGAQVLAGAVPGGDGAVLHVPVAHHQHIGHLLQGGLPDLLADLLAAVVHLHPEALPVQLRRPPGRHTPPARSVTGSTFTCTGASQAGKAPAKCSVMTPMNRSMEPSTTRWSMTGRCFSPSSPVYSSSKRSGSWESSWTVPHCQVRPRESARWKSSLGP